MDTDKRWCTLRGTGEPCVHPWWRRIAYRKVWLQEDPLREPVPRAGSNCCKQIEKERPTAQISTHLQA
ncbi:hypothetical protein HBI56_034710 [Parastagonospora nodorum]|uniref:Uncharacterized protein n=1 Tax=Phaeosphaeria nodorum (strain SN15 / ATCC MYA-4574 / FGSC 10173) TaxID=321614 RepID=A0A7U2I166_PHANO|nr:hypothetical protein HBH56_022500 [Parastagonospora nodorum]QRC95592.1 hypothetical protein JI435_407570 [Parastagonospora nodorum SN15]KAH3937209.1 hypothetical protein HBH54_011970 [Parastagonospora nodorum]KAH3944129.1 hypothetical protein HBH53_164750 [Parastagonospora nodorum]KAH3990748.1 hypothetical protein HBH52_000920 [Parastagonospora nodorum]